MDMLKEELSMTLQISKTEAQYEEVGPPSASGMYI